MKLTKIFATFVGILALTCSLASCNDEEQSSLNIDDIPGKATVIGHVSYNAGYEKFNDGWKDYQYVPAKGKKVFFYMQFSSLDASNSGSKVYETITDNNGDYTIELPANNEGIEYSIKLESFEATKTERTVVPGSSPIEYEYEKVERFYSYSNSTGLTLYANVGDKQNITIDPQN